MALIDGEVRLLKANGRRRKVSDSHGLYLLLPPTGSKLWRWAYRFGGRQKSLALGRYPEVSLDAARTARDEAMQLLAIGIDPSIARKASRRLSNTTTEAAFATVAMEWFEAKQQCWVSGFSSRVRSWLVSDLLPHLGNRPICEIQPLEILEVIRKIERRNAIPTARRVMQVASAIFRYGIAIRRCARNPTADLRGSLERVGPCKHHASLAADRLPTFMRDLDAYRGPIITKSAVALTYLTLVRTTELRFARWSEFENLAGPEPLWRVPAERMKMRRPHLVPLSPQAVELLEKLQRDTGASPYLFPARSKSRVLPATAMISALYRMGYRGKATVHGARATASTVLNDAGFNRDWIEIQLSHFDRRVMGRFNAAEWLPGRRQMMNWWGEYLTRVASEVCASSRVS